MFIVILSFLTNLFYFSSFSVFEIFIDGDVK
jgi:hypothetical protein